MSNPYKTPTTAAEAINQMYLGQMGYSTGTAANSAGLALRQMEEQKKKAREQQAREHNAAKKPWWK